jgi:membrane-bound metal-dependent hydrolase YbcI (DUF457 family)
MPFPLLHGIVAASLFTALQRKISFGKDWKIMLWCAALAILPDADFLLEWVFHLRNSHRGFTHSIAFGVVAGLLVSMLVAAKKFSHRLALVLAPTSHALLDVLTTSRQGDGIELLWPLSDYRFKLGLFDYFLFNLDPRFDPWSEILIRTLKISLLESVIMCPLFILLIFLKLRTQKQNNLSA